MTRSKPPLAITEARAKDAHKAAPVFDAYRRFYGQASDKPAARKFLAERLKHKESRVFLAVSGGEILGFMQLYPSFSSIALKPRWILNDLFVSPVARRSGVAAALLERARNLARETGAEGLVLETAIDNLPAQAAYQKAGWKRDDEFYRYYLDL